MPGPLFTIGGYLGAAAMPDSPVAGSALGVIAIFLPGLLLVTGSLAFSEPIMRSISAKRAMAGVNAVVVGLLGAAFYNPLWKTSIVSIKDVLIAGAALLLLVRFKAPPILIVAASIGVSIGTRVLN